MQRHKQQWLALSERHPRMAYANSEVQTTIAAHICPVHGCMFPNLTGVLCLRQTCNLSCDMAMHQPDCVFFIVSRYFANYDIIQAMLFGVVKKHNTRCAAQVQPLKVHSYLTTAFTQPGRNSVGARYHL